MEGRKDGCKNVDGSAISLPKLRWLQGLLSSSLLRPPPSNAQQWQVEVVAYTELFGQFASETFSDDLSELVRSHYPREGPTLLDDVLATFVLHHPEHANSVLHALLSCIIDGTLVYNCKSPPFGSFVALFNASNERLFMEQWALACAEILRVLTHYNRPIYGSCRILQRDISGSSTGVGLGDMVGEGTSALEDRQGRKADDQGVGASSRGRPVPDGGGTCTESEAGLELANQGAPKDVHGDRGQVAEYETSGRESPPGERRNPVRPLTKWITDCLLAAPPAVRSDYFRWCGGVTGKYVTGGALRPPTTVLGGRGGKNPQLQPSTPRWAMANGAAVILAVCDDEVLRYETADLTAAAVPALLLPPPESSMDENFTGGLPSLEPYARLFHRYYALGTPAATQRLLLGLLEAPPSWAPDGQDATVQLIELIRGAASASEDRGPQLPQSWLHLHFLQPIGVAMASWPGVSADAAAGVLFRIFSQPTLLFPSPPHRHLDSSMPLAGMNEVVAAKGAADVEAGMREDITARGLAALMCGHGKDVEWRICALLETVYGLLPLDASTVALPDILRVSEIQPPVLTWNLVRPFLRLLEYLPRGSPSQACIRRIFSATVRAVLQRTFPKGGLKASVDANPNKPVQLAGGQQSVKSLGTVELRSMVHCLFTEPCPSPDLASQLISDMLTACLSHDAACTPPQSRLRPSPQAQTETPCARNSDSSADGLCQNMIDTRDSTNAASCRGVNAVSGLTSSGEGGRQRQKDKAGDRGVVATVDSYIIATVCALACEVQLLSLSSALFSAVRNAQPSAGGAMAGGGGGSAELAAGAARGGTSQGVKGDGAAAGDNGAITVGQSLNERHVNGVGAAAEHTRRVLLLLEMLLALVPGGGEAIGIVIAEPSSGEIVAAAVVAAHVSSLLAKSRASMHALATITRCRWDPIICDMASKVMVLVEKNSCAVAATMAPQGVGRQRRWQEADAMRGEQEVERGAGRSDSDATGMSGFGCEGRHGSSGCGPAGAGEQHKRDVPQEWKSGRDAEGAFKGRSGGLWRGKEAVEGSSPSGVDGTVSGCVDASDVATLLLCRNGRMGRHWDGGSGEYEGRSIGGGSLMALLMEKQQLALAAVPLLWQRLMSAPEVPLSSEGTSAERGWRQVLEGLCNVVIAFPQQAAAAIVAKAEMELGRWEGEEDMAAVLRGNARIVSLLTEILRLHRCPSAVRVVAQASPLLHRATGGIGLDGEACTLPQLELLESAITAADVARVWEGGQEVAEQLLDVLKDRLPVTVRCLSSNSAHVRALSMALLRHLAYEASLGYGSGQVPDPASCNNNQHMEGIEIANTKKQLEEERDAQDWRRAVEQCLSWEAHFRKSGGLSTSLLVDAASSLGCQILA